MLTRTKVIGAGLLSMLLVLSLTVAAPAIAASQDNDARTLTGKAASTAFSVDYGPTGEDAAPTPADNCTMTIHYLENVSFDDPDTPPDADGRFLLGTRVVTGLHEGQEIDAWDYVADIPGFFFWDGWPAKLTISTDPSQNVLTLTYFRLWNNDYTVNYYLMEGADLTASNWTDALAGNNITFTKMGSQTFTDNPGNLLVEGDAYEYKLDGAYVIDSYPSEIHVGLDPERNVINVLYAPSSATLPDDLEIMETPEAPDPLPTPDEPDGPDQGDGNGEASGTPGGNGSTEGGNPGDGQDRPTLPGDTVLDKDDLITILPDDHETQETPGSTVIDDFVDPSDREEGSWQITDEMLQNPVDKEAAIKTAEAYQTGLEQGRALPKTGDQTPFVVISLIAIAAAAAMAVALVMNRRTRKDR